MTKTPYGGLIVWTLPGGSVLFCHLKEKAVIRNKKRWGNAVLISILLRIFSQTKLFEKVEPMHVLFVLPWTSSLANQVIFHQRAILHILLSSPYHLHASRSIITYHLSSALITCTLRWTTRSYSRLMGTWSSITLEFNVLLR